MVLFTHSHTIEHSINEHNKPIDKKKVSILIIVIYINHDGISIIIISFSKTCDTEKAKDYQRLPRIFAL